MAKFFKNSKDTHAPLEPGESKVIEEQFNDYLEQGKDIGVTLKQLREEKGWTQKKLAEMVGLDEEQLEMFESGKQPIPIATARHFGEIFQTDHETFLWR